MLGLVPSASIMPTASIAIAANRRQAVMVIDTVSATLLAIQPQPNLAFMAPSWLAECYAKLESGMPAHSKRSIPHCQILWPEFSRKCRVHRKPAPTCAINATWLNRRNRLTTPHTSINPRQDPRGAFHIGTIFLPERAHHHLFFTVHTTKEQSAETDQTRRPCNPIGQQQHLSERHQPKRRIHGMTDDAENAGYDERMAFSQIETDRPVFTEIAMGPPKQPQRGHVDHDAEIGQRRHIGIIGKARKMDREID